MMMLRREADNKNGKKMFVAGILLVFLLFISFFWGFPPDFAKRGVLYVSQPLIYFKNYASETISNIGSFFASKKELKNENIFLKQRIADLKIKEVFFDAILDENKELKEVLSYDNSENRKRSSPPEKC